jgi:diaminopimelate epimerase
MEFWKLHGIGNDFIAIDKRFDDKDDYSDIAKKVCHRRFSVGADGLLVVKNSDKADVEMMYYNSDGSRGEMCGNGIRCFAKFVYDKKIVDKKEMYIDTLDGVKKVELNIDNDKTFVKVNMGVGKFDSKSIPVISDKEVFIEEEINVLDRKFKVSSMLMGVPHSVIIVDKLDLDEVKKYGKEIEIHEKFPAKTNVNFVEIKDYNNISVCTWERGCGYTLGCGTGMSASAVICNLLNKVGKNVNVVSNGGTLKIDIEENVYMIGEAVKICEGNF